METPESVTVTSEYLLQNNEEIPSDFGLQGIREIVIDDNERVSDTNEARTSPLPQEVIDDYDDKDIILILKHVDEVIEKVIATNTVEPESENTQQNPAVVGHKVMKRKRMKDSMSLPFQFSGQIFNEQSQKLILNTFHFLENHQNDCYLEDKIKTPQEKAARLLNVSASVIKKLTNNLERGVLEQAGLKRKAKKRILDSVSADDENVIRSIVHELNSKSTRVPASIPSILAEARERINFKGSRTSFRRILKRVGVSYGRIGKKLFMMEPCSLPLGDNHPVTRSQSSHPICFETERTKKPTPTQQSSGEDIRPSSRAFIISNNARDIFTTDCLNQSESGHNPVSKIPPLIQSAGGTTLLTNLERFLIGPASNIVPGEYVFEVDGENLCFRLATPGDMADSNQQDSTSIV